MQVANTKTHVNLTIFQQILTPNYKNNTYDWERRYHVVVLRARPRMNLEKFTEGRAERNLVVVSAFTTEFGKKFQRRAVRKENEY